MASIHRINRYILRISIRETNCAYHLSNNWRHTKVIPFGAKEERGVGVEGGGGVGQWKLYWPRSPSNHLMGSWLTARDAKYGDLLRKCWFLRWRGPLRKVVPYGRWSDGGSIFACSFPLQMCGLLVNKPYKKHARPGDGILIKVTRKNWKPLEMLYRPHPELSKRTYVLASILHFFCVVTSFI